MKRCSECKQYLVCFAEEKNKQSKFNPWIKNQDVDKMMVPCELFNRKDK